MRFRRLYQMAVLALVAILIGLFIFIFNSQQLAQGNTQKAKGVFSVGAYYQQAEYLSVTEELFEQKYLADPNIEDNNYFHVAETNFSSYLQYILQNSSHDEYQVVLQIWITQQRYLDATNKLELAITVQNSQLAGQIDAEQVWPLYKELQSLMDNAVTQENVQSLQLIDQITASENRTATLLPLVCGICFILLMIIGGILSRLQFSLTQAQQREIEHFKQSSLTDNLTGLGNRRSYQERYEQAIIESQQREEPLSLAMIDVDEFKQYNDRYGHTYGDHILTTLAQVLEAAQPRGEAFRLGGDEFAMILHQTRLDQASLILEELRTKAEQSLSGVTLSIGVAALEQSESAMPLLQEQADAAVYEAKRRGRNKIVTFAEIADTVVLFTPEQEQTLRDLLHEKQITIVFQPIWDLDQQEIIAFEALMRPHEKYHLRGPQEAFDIAERLGHLYDLDIICCEAILANAHRLPAKAKLFMNISPQTLEHPSFVKATFVDAVRLAGLSPEQVVLEITERSITRPEIVVRAAKGLKNYGFGLALDDAGTGNSGLAVLSKLAVDYVKIDKSVINNAGIDMASRAVLAGITAIAYETKSYVIAEGIEDPATLAFIRQFTLADVCKVHGVQGYLLGKPNAKIQAFGNISFPSIIAPAA